MAKHNDIETLFKENYSGLHRLAAMILHDTEAAHDIVHDVFTEILDNNSGTSFEPGYLAASVRNRCLNRLKAIDVRERFRNLYLLEYDDQEEISDWPDEEILCKIDRVEETLPPKCAEVFRLRFRENFSSKEISENLGISERGVYKHIRHALTILKQKIYG